MTQTYKPPIRDIEFALFEVLGFEQHYQTLGYEDVNQELMTAIVTEMAKFSEKQLSPLNAVGDQQGCVLVNGSIKTPDGFKQAFADYRDGGWFGLAQPEELDGQGLPHSLAIVLMELIHTANHAWTMYVMLINGAIATLRANASPAIQHQFLPALIAGQSAATMCLTEAHCGSDLGLLRSKAVPDSDGSYLLSGSKIFISGGEQDFTDNILHLVLARLPDAPAGVKGISLFVVPKMQTNADGSLGGSNNVTCSAIEEKMGIHGNPTCVINFDNAKGYMIGEANKGLQSMFTFVNESRLGVAQQAQGAMELSYQNAANYALERLQMKAPSRRTPAQAADPIIAHPDVRRMLLTQKSLAEGGRLLNFYCAQQVDLSHSTNSDSRSAALTRLALLTPIAKGFLSEVAIEATNHGIQIFGGHGYVRESGIEQIARDVRITSIYEGTSGIQALDLLGRKILADNGDSLKAFCAEINTFCSQQDSDFSARYGEPLQNALQSWQTLSTRISYEAQQDPELVGAVSYDFLMLSGYTVLAYCWAMAASVAQKKLATDTDNKAYYQSKIHLANFYFAKLLPRTHSFESTINNGSTPLTDLADEDFLAG